MNQCTRALFPQASIDQQASFQAFASGGRVCERSVQKLTNKMAAGNGLNLFLLIFSVIELLTLKILGGTYVSPRTSPQPGAPARA